MDAKTRGIVAYITLIGWVIALVTNNPKDEQTTFHLRQGLGLNLAWIVSTFFIWLPIIGWILPIALFVFWIIGLLSALEGSQKEVPVIGSLFQSWFKNL
ncbi:hypothetical protein [Pelagicoccus mobilis]|uniref:DUF4870 domain-containing protein n=1 Tax=Pelagicoccus mobilis TaxID=415221 RepID=A0A934RXC1_9BACT|nr:hypothetical protein [Pelagicoccus mobilis]MBK1878276.1 hypothetical protein [Pelagicoccus mobilis]